ALTESGLNLAATTFAISNAPFDKNGPTVVPTGTLNSTESKAGLICPLRIYENGCFVSEFTAANRESVLELVSSALSCSIVDFVAAVSFAVGVASNRT